MHDRSTSGGAIEVQEHQTNDNGPPSCSGRAVVESFRHGCRRTTRVNEPPAAGLAEVRTRFTRIQPDGSSRVTSWIANPCSFKVAQREVDRPPLELVANPDMIATEASGLSGVTLFSSSLIV